MTPPVGKESRGKDSQNEEIANNSSQSMYKKPAVRRRPPYIPGATDYEIIRDVQCSILDLIISKGGSCDLDDLLSDIQLRPDQKWFVRQALSGLTHNGGAHKPKLIAFVKYGMRWYTLNPTLPIPNTSRRSQNVLVSVLGYGL